MIYLDSSVALAHLLGETRVPPASIWQESLVSSRLLESIAIFAGALTATASGG